MIHLSNRIRRMRMKWTGQILRMSDNKTVKQVFRWEPSSRRSRGRKRWMNCVEDDLHRAGISRYGITTGRQRVSLHAGNSRRQKSMEEVGGGIDGWNRLCDDNWPDLTWPDLTWRDLIYYTVLASYCHVILNAYYFYYCCCCCYYSLQESSRSKTRCGLPSCGARERTVRRWTTTNCRVPFDNTTKRASLRKRPTPNDLSISSVPPTCSEICPVFHGLETACARVLRQNKLIT